MPNTIKTRSGRTIIVNTPEEDAAIQRGIDADPDAHEVSQEDFAKLKRLGVRGRPKLGNPKVQLTVRYDADIVERFRSTGEGWQSRMNDALRQWLDQHGGRAA